MIARRKKTISETVKGLWLLTLGAFLPFYLLTFLPSPVAAQTIVNLTAEQVKIDTLLPVYTYSRPLPATYADSIYTVSIEYPEFVPMSKADQQRYAAISGRPLPALPVVNHYVSVSRKQATLNVSFVPLVARGGRMQKLASFQLKVKAEPRTLSRRNSRRAGASFADASLLATGRWAKIRVSESGIFQLTDALIRKAGFSNLSKVRIYGYGGARQPEALTADYLAATDDLQELPTCTVGGRRLFYAQGPVSWSGATRTRNPYSSYGYYFLTESDEAPLTVDETAFLASFYPSDAFHNSLYEVDDFAWYQGGRNLFDAQLFTIGSARTYTLPSAAGAGRVTIVLSAASDNGSSTATVSINDVPVGTINVSQKVSYSSAMQTTSVFNVTNLQASNTVKITQTAGGAMRLDYIAIYSNDVQAAPSLSAASYAEPEFVETVAPQNRHADEAADMIIIVPSSGKLTAQAERLKALHEQYDQLRVRIVPAHELYNEYASGTPDANAYRRYLRMLYERAATDDDMPRYLMLFGDGAWDNRMLSSNWKNYKPEDFLLCYESENSLSSTECYVSDDYFCLLDDGEGGDMIRSDRADVAVGRFPVRTADEAKILVDKVENYLKNEQAGAWQNTLCFMGDDGNGNMHMQDADTVARLVERLYPAYQVKRVMWDAYERTTSATGHRYPDVTQLIKQQMQNGALVMNYSGHGAPYALSHELVMQLPDFRDAVSARLPLWVTASCDIMPFDGQEANIGESALLNKRGGAIAFFGTTRTVYASYNRQMNLAFMPRVLSGISIGEAARLAKGALIDNIEGMPTDLTTNKLQYTLLGDPALRLTTPQLTAVIDSINGRPVSSVTPATLQPGTTVRVRGHIEKGQTLHTGFNGVVTATIRDAAEEITCRLNDTSDDGAQTPFVYTDRTKTLYHGSDSVQAGVFSFRFAVPQDISYSNATGLINVYAVSNDRSEMANGTSDALILGGAAPAGGSSTGPKLYCYLNNESFVDGGNVNVTPYFVALISDEDGVNATGNGIGHDMQLIIDGNMNQTYVLNDYFTYDFGSYTSGTVGFSIPALSYGWHRLQFRAWDVLNNSATTELTFNVVEGLEPVFFDVECTANPATTSTSFRILHDRTGSEMDFVLDVFDMTGRHLWQHAESGVPTDGTYTIDWNLTSGGGSRVGTGVYLYRIRISSDGSSYASKAKKIIVISNK